MPHISLPTGTRIYYNIWRGGQTVGIDGLDRSKPTVVLVHPCLADSTAWKKQVQDPRLSNAYNLVTFDSKFHGRSTGPVNPSFTYRDGARDLACAMDMLKLPPSHFVGESYGARRVVHLAVDRPDLVLSMMLISPGVFGEEPDEHQEPIRELRDLMMDTNRMWQNNRSTDPDAASVIFPRDVSLGYIAYHFGDTLDPESMGEEIERFNNAHARHAPEITAELLNAYLNKKPIANLDRVKVPILLLRGSRNTTEDPSIACELWKAAFCNSENLEFHLVHGAPLRATAAFPFLVTRFMAGWLAKNAARKQPS